MNQTNRYSPPSWIFCEYSENEKRRDSSSDKHFSGLNISESLVRELIQNSLDAVEDKENPVEIKITSKELDKNTCVQYLEGLKRHYKASYDKEMLLNQKIKFLILEDFNTTGLSGSKKRDFFLKDNIRSDTNRSSGGSHGIGKVVFYEASTIKTFFAYSVYEGENVFQGSCDFKTHKIEGQELKEDGSLQLSPKNDEDFIKKLFSRTKNQRGLSIAVPLPEEDALTELERVIVKEYYYPIINNKLVVEHERITIKEDYILEQEDEKQKLISDYITKEGPDFSIDIGDKYKDRGSEFSIFNEDQQKQITSKLEENDPIVIRFNFLLKFKEKDKKGYLDFCITKKRDEQRKDKKYDDKKFDFWRENLLIKDASKMNNRSSQYVVIILIHGEDNELSVLLRKLENPSHTKWDYKKSKNDYKYIGKLVPFVTQLPNKVITQIKSTNVKLDSSFFSDYFPDKAIRKKPSQGKPEVTGNTDISPASNNPNVYFRLNRKENGFILSLSDKGKQCNISKITITIAYVTNQGDPFKNYDIKDFDLQKNIKVKLENGEQIEKEKNQLSCQVKNTDFIIYLSNFDPDRELIIDVKDE